MTTSSMNNSNATNSSMTSSSGNSSMIKRRFTLMQFLLWFTFGTFGIFYVAYLRDLGYSSKFIALGLTLSTISGILSQYVWGYISDLTSRIKSIFLGLLIAMMVVVSLFIFVVNTSYLAILGMILFHVTWMPLEALLDSWILSTDDLSHDHYGSIRSGGSLGFSVITLFFGSMIVSLGFRISPIAFILSGTALFIVALTTKTHTTKTPTTMGLTQIKLLLSNRRYVGILFFSVLIFVGHMGVNNFYIYVVSNIGGDESLVGTAASFAAFTEIGGFFLAGKLQKKVSPLFLMIGVAVGSFCRVFFLAQAQTYVGVLATAVIQGLTFSMFLGTFKVYITKITPLSLLASAQTLGASTYFGVASIIANIFGGLLIEDYGMTTFYNFMIIIAVITVAYSLALYWFDKKYDTI